jgi:hypothetical protein
MEKLEIDGQLYKDLRSLDIIKHNKCTKLPPKYSMLIIENWRNYHPTKALAIPAINVINWKGQADINNIILIDAEWFH